MQGLLMKFVCAHGGGVRVCLCVLVCMLARVRFLHACAHAHTKLGVTMDSKGAFEVF